MKRIYVIKGLLLDLSPTSGVDVLAFFRFSRNRLQTSSLQMCFAGQPTLLAHHCFQLLALFIIAAVINPVQCSNTL